VIERTAAERGCACVFIAEPWTRSPVGLTGSHQRWNAQLAATALQTAMPSTTAVAVERGLATVRWPGRFQRHGERTILDGAHNPAAALQLAATWRAEFGDAKATLIFAAMRDKDVRGVLAALRPIAARVLAVPVENSRACRAEELCSTLRAVDPGCRCEPHENLASALTSASRHPERILITGSLFLVGEALASLDPASPQPEHSAQ
jgi:dihydrofolate synthase/folylpolyglutamate synthase